MVLGLVDEESEERVDADTLAVESPSYALFVLLYFTKERSSFCSETPVN